MSYPIDARIPVIFASLAEAGPLDALLVEGDTAPLHAAVFKPQLSPGHAPGCVCCAPRNAAGEALGRLMLARAHRQIPFFTRVVAVMSTAEGREAVMQALATDPLASSRFRLDQLSGRFRLDQRVAAAQLPGVSPAPRHARDT